MLNQIKRDDTPVRFYNPLKSDFIATLRDNKNINFEYVIPSREIVKYPKYLADILIKDLTTEVMNKKGVSPMNFKEIEKIKEKITNI